MENNCKLPNNRKCSGNSRWRDHFLTSLLVAKTNKKYCNEFKHVPNSLSAQVALGGVNGFLLAIWLHALTKETQESIIYETTTTSGQVALSGETTSWPAFRIQKQIGILKWVSICSNYAVCPCRSWWRERILTSLLIARTHTWILKINDLRPDHHRCSDGSRWRDHFLTCLSVAKANLEYWNKF